LSVAASTWCRIEVDGRPVFGLVEGGEIAAIDAAPYLPHRRTGARYRLAGAKLLHPVDPPNFYAAGLNYRPHIEWCNRHHGTKFAVPGQADIGYRSANALTGSGAEVILPADSTGSFEYEGELAVVVGRRTRDISEADALSSLAGYTLGNDLSERAWQFSDRTLWRAKNCDGFKPMGPVVVPGLDPMNLEIAVRINGRTVSTYNTRDMIFGVQQYIARMSRYLTLVPGDIIWFGCDGATIPSLEPGDLVEVHCDEIGTLANRIVRGS
jgi:2-keto-4-pentenoate hydratase/2-oxohepta-3-ene-1,7-dioic acid hydratase in catechol pathway